MAVLMSPQWWLTLGVFWHNLTRAARARGLLLVPCMAHLLTNTRKRSYLAPLLRGAALLLLGGCRSTSSDSPSAGGSAGQGTGGAGTGGLGTGGNPQQTGCRGLEKAYRIFSSTPGSYFRDPYLLLRTEGESCTAVVAVQGYPARSYSVSFGENLVTLRPNGEPAKGGSSSLTTFHLYAWKEIRLGHNQTELSGSGETAVFYRWDEEDVWGEESLTWKIELRQPEPAELDLDKRMLPWAATPVGAFPPVPTLASHLEGPTSVGPSRT